MRQLPFWRVFVHESVFSLHASWVHVNGSPQVRGVPTQPRLPSQWSSVVQKRLSLQATLEGCGLHADWVVFGSQRSQVLDGFDAFDE